ncbi:hypothetical protein P7D22_20925, partial [Lichenihabitans sp. Uapishka_5]|nr:hypothetical protein [Lichenihabitans sp. Uapishka_5]
MNRLLATLTTAGCLAAFGTPGMAMPTSPVGLAQADALPMLRVQLGNGGPVGGGPGGSGNGTGSGLGNGASRGTGTSGGPAAGT